MDIPRVTEGGGGQARTESQVPRLATRGPCPTLRVPPELSSPLRSSLHPRLPVFQPKPPAHTLPSCWRRAGGAGPALHTSAPTYRGLPPPPAQAELYLGAFGAKGGKGGVVLLWEKPENDE